MNCDLAEVFSSKGMQVEPGILHVDFLSLVCELAKNACRLMRPFIHIKIVYVKRRTLPVANLYTQ